MSNNYYTKLDFKRIFHKIIGKYFLPFKAANVQLSVISSANDDKSVTSKFLFDIALKSAQIAYDIDLSTIEKRENIDFKYVQIYPGEHYKLLAGLMQVLKPKIVIEIGTYLGQSALTMKAFLDEDAKIYTFDINAWNSFDATCLNESDFKSGQMVQYLDDLSEYENFQKHKAIIENADFIFIDAMKDGIQEIKFLKNLEAMNLKQNCIVMFDDIRVWNMVKIWRKIVRPKLDLTSFGHWSGTGLIHWNG